MSIMLVGFTDDFCLEAAKVMVESGAPVSHISLVVGPFRGKPGRFGPFFAEHAVTLIDELTFHKPSFIRALNARPGSIPSAEMLRALTHCENQFLAASDRVCFIPISVRERRRLYFSLVQYWYNFLQDARIESVVFAGTAHMGWDLVLHHVAKYLGLNVQFFNITWLGDRVVFRSDIETPECVPDDFLPGASNEALIDYIGEPMYTATQYNVPHTVKEFEERTAMIGKDLKLKWKSLAWMGLHYRAEIVRSALFYNENIRTNGNLLPEYFGFWREQVFRHRYYQQLATRPDYGSTYVFFGLHYQPERTTLPDGGIFEDQLLALEILSAALPEDWLIYVKEHPAQFQMRMQARHTRSEHYYRHLAEVPKVRIIDVREDPVELMQRSAFVATITGTVGWESIQFGRACMVFGNPWYSGCRSSFRVDSVESCRDAIRAIASRSPEEVEHDRLRFLAYMKDYTVNAPDTHAKASKSKIPYATLVRNLAEGIIAHTQPHSAAVEIA